MEKPEIDVKRIASLARLDLTEEEAVTFQTQLEAIVAHVDQLSSITLPENDLDSCEAKFAPIRQDLPVPSLTQTTVLNNAPDQSLDQIRVPKVVADA